MDPTIPAFGEYSVVADLLNKFHTASEIIQALMIVAMMVTVLGVAWIGMRGLVEVMRVRRRNAADLVMSGTDQDRAAYDHAMRTALLPFRDIVPAV
ncbi:hypothetical protein HI113_45155, partial [Corallococcus exiguus]|nr:hypothetical protein [Corallococcus exiguus]